MTPDEFIATMVDERYAQLLRQAYLLCGDRAHAEDLVQETAIRLLKAAPQHGVEHMEAYARRIMLRLYLRESKRWQRERKTQLEAAFAMAQAPGHSEIPRIEQRSDILTALHHLPSMQRAVLVLRYYDDLSESEIASALRITVGSVRKHAARGRDRMKETLARGDGS